MFPKIEKGKRESQMETLEQLTSGNLLQKVTPVQNSVGHIPTDYSAGLPLL